MLFAIRGFEFSLETMPNGKIRLYDYAAGTGRVFASKEQAITEANRIAKLYR